MRGPRSSASCSSVSRLSVEFLPAFCGGLMAVRRHASAQVPPPRSAEIYFML
ncbi:hypothetical protein JKF63_01962 [Porcisia hertigi]|uniref:Uncharacterized protein n=1 Tax=Porcisia hertigi TaxID=2761500 RepID=A0A836H5P5_9TRYP|nr:hypothetical protein JKF63_01962 [Porcisia hertigi]